MDPYRCLGSESVVKFFVSILSLMAIRFPPWFSCGEHSTGVYAGLAGFFKFLSVGIDPVLACFYKITINEHPWFDGMLHVVS